MPRSRLPRSRLPRSRLPRSRRALSPPDRDRPLPPHETRRASWYLKPMREKMYRRNPVTGEWERKTSFESVYPITLLPNRDTRFRCSADWVATFDVILSLLSLFITGKIWGWIAYYWWYSYKNWLERKIPSRQLYHIMYHYVYTENEVMGLALLIVSVVWCINWWIFWLGNELIYATEMRRTIREAYFYSKRWFWNYIFMLFFWLVVSNLFENEDYVDRDTRKFWYRMLDFVFGDWGHNAFRALVYFRVFALFIVYSYREALYYLIWEEDNLPPSSLQLELRRYNIMIQEQRRMAHAQSVSVIDITNAVVHFNDVDIRIRHGSREMLRFNQKRDNDERGN